MNHIQYSTVFFFYGKPSVFKFEPMTKLKLSNGLLIFQIGGYLLFFKVGLLVIADAYKSIFKSLLKQLKMCSVFSAG